MNDMGKVAAAAEMGDGSRAGAGGDAMSAASPQQRPTARKRVRNFTADDRAAHRMFEKSRREAFKGRLIQLAGLIPNLVETDTRRLSKHVVVDESIARHKLQQLRCLTAIPAIRALADERDALISEVNRWRAESAGLEGGGRPVALREPVVRLDAFALLFAAERDTLDEARGRASSAGAADDGESHGTGGGSLSGEEAVAPPSSYHIRHPVMHDAGIIPDSDMVAVAPGGRGMAMGFSHPRQQRQQQRQQQHLDMPAAALTSTHVPMSAMARDPAGAIPHAIFGGFELGELEHPQQPQPQPQSRPQAQLQQQQQQHLQPPPPLSRSPHHPHHHHPGIGYAHQQTHTIGVDLRHHHAGGGVVSPMPDVTTTTGLSFDSAQPHPHPHPHPHPQHQGQHLHHAHPQNPHHHPHPHAMSSAVTMPMEAAVTQAPYIDQLGSTIPYMGVMPWSVP